MAKSRTYRKTRSTRRVLLRRILDFLILVAVLWLAYTLAGRSLRQVAVAQVAGLTNAQVKAESIDFNFDGSVSIEKLVIRPEEARPYDNAILKAETVYARFDIGSLLLVRPRLREISIDDFVFNAQCDLDAGQWNTAGLKINIPKAGIGRLPVVRLKGGMLQYSKVSKSDVTIVTEVPVDASFETAEEESAAYTFTITTAKAAPAGVSTLNGRWRPGRVTITGGISSADVPSLERAWEIKTLAAVLSYDANDAYTLQLKIKDCLSSDGVSDIFALDGPSLAKSWSVFDILQRFFARFSPAGHIDLDLAASGNLKRLVESELNGKVYCKDVSIRDVKFPYHVQHIAGEVDFTEQGVTLNDLSGEHDDVDLTFSGWSRDFGPDWQYQIRIKSNNMALDEELYEALNPKQKKLWSAFSLDGIAAIDYTFSRQPRTLEKKSLKVRLFDAEATYENFPYALKNLAGNLLFEADDITISDLVSRYDGREIMLNGQVAALSTDRPIYDVSISAKDVPLDSELAAAMPPKQRNFYEQFDMAGIVDAEVKVFTPEPNAGPTAFTADVSVTKASLKLEQLPLDINDISAKGVVTGDWINIQDFTGRYDRASVSLAGRVWPTEKAEQKRYCLKLQAEQMQLNDNLIELLPASLREVFSDWQLKGKVNISADLNKDAPDDCPDYKLVVGCLGNSLDFRLAKAAPNEAPVAYRPSPYPLKDVTGRLIITADNIKLENMTAAVPESAASENRTTIKLNGDIALADNAFNSGRFRLSADDIAFDDRLSAALPTDIRDMYVKLAPGGRFDLNLEDIKVSGTTEGQRQVDFEGNAKLRNCDFDIWPPVTDLNAVLDVNGVYNSGSGFTRGRVVAFMDGFKVDGRTITALKADMNYDNRRRSWLTDNWVGDCCGGKLTGKLEFRQPAEQTSQYLLQVGFNDIDLKQFLSEPNGGQTHLEALPDRAGYSRDTRQELQINGTTSGKMSGSLSLTAGASGSSSRIGRCRLIITDMHIGKPSPLAKLLYVLQLTDSKDFVFQQMFVDSYIKNDRLMLEKFDLSGESLAFNGAGLMDLDTKDVDLTLTVRGKRLADAEPSVLESLAENIGGYVVRMDVTGNAYDPDVKIKTLPVIKDSLQILGKKSTSSNP